jgi:predicted Zn-dependent protease
MAEAKHYKITRKTLRQPDEFQTLTGEAFDWIADHQSAVVGAMSAIVAVAALVLGIGWYGQRQADAAAVRLQSAQALFDAGKFPEAAAEFGAVASAYPRTPSGRLATLYRAHALAAVPDPTSAADAYAAYLTATPPTEYLRQQALLGLARANEMLAKREAAAEAYREAAQLTGPFVAQAQVGLARLEEAAGRADVARGLYAEALKAQDLDPDTRSAIASRVPEVSPPTP